MPGAHSPLGREGAGPAPIGYVRGSVQFSQASTAFTSQQRSRASSRGARGVSPCHELSLGLAGFRGSGWDRVRGRGGGCVSFQRRGVHTGSVSVLGESGSPGQSRGASQRRRNTRPRRGAKPLGPLSPPSWLGVGLPASCRRTVDSVQVLQLTPGEAA